MDARISIEEQLQLMSVKELKLILQRRNINSDDCLEKTDLIRKILNSNDETSAPIRSRRIQRVYNGFSEWSEVIGDLECIGLVPQNTIETDLELIVILCHGFGANNENLVPLGRTIIANRKRKECTALSKIGFFFPSAPISLYDLRGGRAWWPLNFQEITQGILLGKINDILGKEPEGLSNSRMKLRNLVNQLAGLNASDKTRKMKIILAGFSQGSILAVDCALHWLAEPNPLPINGLCVFSGIPNNFYEWKKLCETQPLKGLPVLQSHGTKDEVLPYAASTLLKEFFESQKAAFEFVSFDEGHIIPPIVLSRFEEFLFKNL